MPETPYQGSQGKLFLEATTGNAAPTKEWGVTSWDCSVSTKSVKTTTTKHWNATTKRVWARRHQTESEATGSFDVILLKEDLATGTVRAGLTMALLLNLDDADDVIAGPVYIESVDVKNGGPEDVIKASVKWSSNGDMTLPGDPTGP